MKKILYKFLNFPQLIKVLFTPKKVLERWNPHTDLDLELYSKIFSYRNLHYGYFSKPTEDYKKISFHDLENALDNYSSFLVKKLTPHQYLLDVGCGNGTILNLLHQAKKKALGVTPNLQQVGHINNNYKSLKVVDKKFEDLMANEIPFLKKLEVIFMAESFQYIPISLAISKVKEIFSHSKSNLSWVIFDYFRISDKTQNPSGHGLSEFKDQLKRAGLKIKKEIDCTRNVIPTLGYVYFLINTFTAPLLEHYQKNLHFTHPLAAYFLSDILRGQVGKINFEVVNPKKFAEEKKYLYLEIN